MESVMLIYNIQDYADSLDLILQNMKWKTILSVIINNNIL